MQMVNPESGVSRDNKINVLPHPVLSTTIVPADLPLYTPMERFKVAYKQLMEENASQ